GDSLAWLLATAHHLPPAELAGAVAEALARVGAVSARLFLADHGLVSLHPFGPPDEETTSFGIDGTVAGRAFALEMTCSVSINGGVRLWVPVVDGTARLGVLGVDLTAEDAGDAQTQSSVEHVASLAAQLLVTKGEYSDAVELVRRNREMSLAAELQRGTLPPMTLATSRVMVAGILEPAYEVAGDTFDYALNTDMLHVAIIDSVGHDIESSVISQLVNGSLRHSRRNGRNLPEAYFRANEALTTSRVMVTGILEPAYEVAGDTFDYALNTDMLHVAIIDSVGHDIESAVISHLVQGSLRNSRRDGRDLPDVYVRANAALTTVFRELTFATAAFGHLDLTSGRFSWVSAGHPPPLVVRRGKVVHEADTVPVLPIGLSGAKPTVNELVLEPGDMLLLYTDGVVEGGARGTERFGLDRLTDLLSRNLLADLPPAETLRRLVRAVLEHAAHELHDDLTMVLVEFRTGATNEPRM
ncbi:MAG: PP2C family protein-serine/threonine phosphatase, partial [Candidatus Limnocylindrales bacterium]